MTISFRLKSTHIRQWRNNSQGRTNLQLLCNDLLHNCFPHSGLNNAFTFELQWLLYHRTCNSKVEITALKLCTSATFSQITSFHSAYVRRWSPEFVCCFQSAVMLKSTSLTTKGINRLIPGSNAVTLYTGLELFRYMFWKRIFSPTLQDIRVTATLRLKHPGLLN